MILTIITAVPFVVPRLSKIYNGIMYAETRMLTIKATVHKAANQPISYAREMFLEFDANLVDRTAVARDPVLPTICAVCH